MAKLEIRAVIKYFCNFQVNSLRLHGNPWEGVSFLQQQSLRGGESVDDDGRSDRPNDATADKNVKIVPWLCVIGVRPAKRS